ncbi:hypothetical protein GCM10009826_28130 [Humibacillus xanthopallidus]
MVATVERCEGTEGGIRRRFDSAREDEGEERHEDGDTGAQGDPVGAAMRTPPEQDRRDSPPPGLRGIGGRVQRPRV